MISCISSHLFVISIVCLFLSLFFFFLSEEVQLFVAGVPNKMLRHCSDPAEQLISNNNGIVMEGNNSGSSNRRTGF